MEGQVPNISEPNRGGINEKSIFDEDECVSYKQLTAKPRVLYDLYTTSALPFMVLDFSTSCQQQFAI